MKIDKQWIFMGIVLLLLFLPHQVYALTNTFIGRFLFVSLIALVSYHSMTMGLFLALIMISALNQYRPFVENMENATSTTTATATTEKPKGVDREAIKMAILAKASNSLPVTSTESSENVTASTEGMLNRSSTLSSSAF